jgi:hypothetical protein
MLIKSIYHLIYLGEVGLIVLAKKRGCDSLVAKFRGQASATAGFRGQASATAEFRGQASLTDSQHPATNNTFYGLSMAELSRLASQHEANLQQLRQQSFENELGTGGWSYDKHEVSLHQLRKQSFENELETGG